MVRAVSYGLTGDAIVSVLGGDRGGGLTLVTADQRIVESSAVAVA